MSSLGISSMTRVDTTSSREDFINSEKLVLKCVLFTVVALNYILVVNALGVDLVVFSLHTLPTLICHMVAESFRQLPSQSVQTWLLLPP